MEGSSNKSVYVGNIPHDVTDDDLANLFRQFGEVNSFKIVFDSTTGKTKGFGFCEFAHPESAEAAKRMNNIVSINGRTLKVQDAVSQPSTSSSFGARSNYGPSAKQARDLDTALAQLSIGEVYDILKDVKAWVKQDPEAVRELLNQRPILAQALLKMQTQMGMLQTAPPAEQSFGSIAAYAQSAPQSVQSSVPSLLPSMPQPAPSMMPQPSFNPLQYFAPMPYAMGAFPPPPHAQMQGHAVLPGLPPQAPPPPEALQQDMLRQILMMSEDQVAQMPRPQQDQIRAIRMQYAPH